MTELKTPSQLRDMAVQKTAATLQSIAKQDKASVGIDELKLINAINSDIVTLVVENTDTADHLLVFGTPLGVVEDYKNQAIYGQLPADSHFLDAMGTTSIEGHLINDNLGADAKFIKTLNNRFLRHPVIVSQTEVITSNDTLGNKQATEQFKKVIIPLNSASDSSQSSGAFVPRYTEYTATLLQNGALIFGEFSGVIYKLFAGAKVQINFYIAGIDRPQFVI